MTMLPPGHPFLQLYGHRFNPNHDPETGQFTSGDGGGSGGSAEPTQSVSEQPTRQVRVRSRSAGRHLHSLSERNAGQAARADRAAQKRTAKEVTNGGPRAAVFVSGRAFDPIAAYMRGLFERFNPNHDPANGQFTSGSGGSASTEAAPAAPAKTASVATAKPATTGKEPDSKGAKIKAKIDDFMKDKVFLGYFANDKARADKFIEDWDSRVGESPGEFKHDFLGGVDAEMKVDVNGDTWDISGRLLRDGRAIGEYQRQINWRDKSAYSAYFKLYGSETDKGIGKKLLAGNIAFYQKAGIEKVKVTANIDVGGYAWAKYGYVPTASAWANLKDSLQRKLGGGSRVSQSSSSDSYTPESWEEISDHDQSQIESAWQRSTYDEFYQSEVDHWRDSGNALDDAKTEVASSFESRNSSERTWAHDAVNDWLDEREKDERPVPYTATQLINAISIDYASGYEGRGKLDVTFDDDELKSPKGTSNKQETLPGIEPEDLSQRLTPEMRDTLETVISEAFDKHSESVAEDLDPPSYIADSVSEYQGDYWDQMDEHERYRWAERNGELPSYDIENDDEDEEEQHELDVEPESDEAKGLDKLVRSNDPKAIWAIADSPQGKDMLLGSGWQGVLNLKDPETMERFNAYVGNKKAA